VVGLLRCHYPDFLGQGLSALLSNISTQFISPLRPLIKMLAAAISLGTGASLGPEGPSVEIGSSVGILLGQKLKVSKERYRLLLGAGAAAGLAAGFNAPIAGVFFALEIILGTMFSTPAVTLLLLSAVVSAVIAGMVLGGHPAFALPSYEVLSNWEWFLYIGLGLVASVVSIIFIQGIQFAESCFRGEVRLLKRLGKVPPLVKPVLGGLSVGIVGLFLPNIFGVGYGTLENILKGSAFPLQALGLLLVSKLLLTAICIGSGLVGGIFAPAMFVGACLGSIYGQILQELIPNGLFEIAPPAAYAMVGMAAVLGGSVRAPLTAIILLFELTQNYEIILPLMAAVGVSVWMVDQLKASHWVTGLKLPQMGMNLEKQNELDWLGRVSAAMVMDKSFVGLSESLSLREAGQIMIDRRCYTALVVDHNQDMVGIITLTDIKRKLTPTTVSPRLEEKLKNACTTKVLCAYEQEPLVEVLQRMETRGLGLLPVINNENPRKILGVIERHQISLAADLAMTKEAIAETPHA
jgi:H+/Cl- antiporter ClcA